MRQLVVLALLCLAGVVSASAMGRPPDFCTRFPTHPKCSTTPSTSSPGTTTAPPPPQTGAEQYGIAVGAPSFIVTFNGGRFDEFMAHAVSIGAQVVRFDYSPGSVNFDRAYRAAVAAGLQVVPILILKCGDTETSAASKAQSLISAYPDVQKIELGNEPNGASQYGCAPNAVQYTRLEIAAAKELGDRFLIAAGLAEYGANDSTHINAVDFTKAEIAGGLAGYVDGWGYHSYSSWAWTTQINQVHQALLYAGISAPLEITEMGAATTGGPYSGVSESAQAQLVTDRIATARQTDWIADVYWYSLQDHNTTTGTSREDHFGLFHTDWSAKPAADAFRTAIS